jgi:hypothetical protein
VKRRHLAAILIGHALAAAGCSYDFNVFDPSRLDAAADASLDASVDAPILEGGPDVVDPATDSGDGAPACTPRVGCLTGAASCSTICAQDEQTCEAKVGCGLDPQCVPSCKTAETTCKDACIATCTTCTADGGCADVPACTTAAK